MWLSIGIILVVATTFLAALILRMLKKSEEERYYNAAAQMIREEILNDSISREKKILKDSQLKMMVYIKCNGRQKDGYVFHGAREIRIGRKMPQYGIYLKDKEISSFHCRIIWYEGRLWLEDMQSSNGTFIRRGLQKHQVDRPICLRSRERVYLGNSYLDIQIFQMDTTFL